ncbi:MAG: transposase [Deltaproteobacteria bacterium]|nr:transposase [Deltaproteobacteria bacterium]
MARPLRIEYPYAIYHVTSRGNARHDIYRNDSDKNTFLNVLESVVERYNWLCHAYCLMKNHYHLVIETPDGNLSKGMRHLNGVYTQKFNYRYNNVGHLFQGRYKAILVEKESYLLSLCRYIVLNPVRTGIVSGPERWPWSSYRAMAGMTQKPPFLTIDWLLLQFGETREKAIQAYTQYIYDGIDEKPPWTEVKGQIFLGSIEFIDRLKPHLEEQHDAREVPREHRFANRPSLEDLRIELEGKDKRERGNLIYRAYVEYGYTMNEISNLIGVHYTTVSRTIRRIEKTKGQKMP